MLQIYFSIPLLRVCVVVNLAFTVDGDPEEKGAPTNFRVVAVNYLQKRSVFLSNFLARRDMLDQIRNNRR